MDHTLRCNSLPCRKELNDHAVVTTCSHVFCIGCSNRCQLSSGRDGQRPICPACDMHLTNPDDVVVANLNPTEDYKTSVLSGLSPNVIMECAGRALSFWAYQTTQEVVYQEYMAKNLTEKYASLNAQMDKIIHDANDEISNLRNKLSTMAVDQDNLSRKNEKLIQAFREKSRKQMQTQELYDKLKRRAMLGQVQNAAGDAAEHTIQASVTANRFVDRMSNQPQQPMQPPQLPNMHTSNMHPSAALGGNNAASSRARDEGGTWAGFGSKSGPQQNQPVRTPSTHRQRLASGNGPAVRLGMSHVQPNSNVAHPLSQRASNGRSPLANVNGNSPFAGYGMSAGLKVSNLTNSSANGFCRPIIRSRVAQRPTSNLQPIRNPEFGGAPSSSMVSNGERYY